MIQELLQTTQILFYDLQTNLNNMVEYVPESFLLQVLTVWQPWPYCVIIREQKKKWSLELKKQTLFGNFLWD